MQRRARTVAYVLLPALIAALSVWCEPVLTRWAKEREAVLPFVVFLLLAALMHPRLRTLLMTTLCYFVACLAVRDAINNTRTPLPELLNYDFVYQLRPAALCIVAGLAAVAAFTESLHPGTVWARRCYFGAAALYFIGIGVYTFCWHYSWQALLLTTMGFAALYGCFFAHEIVASETESEESPESDVVEQQDRETQHLHALRVKEWREPLTALESGANETHAIVSTSPHSVVPQ